ncbi:tyrosine-type recombinase/integrase [Aeromonas caviae]|uniref:tyrosine-type recombinase/integrase n=1 Tax=Aeromonas caviae TaxID=648 RepID=UPI00191FE00F|nr:site-specific integrase [Aeromonas caviae]MBL0581640.1 tyrosine-type recombinase/integrase [Aeromonas caviae]
MAISDSWLRGVNGKPYSGQSEVTDGDGLGVRVSPKGLITFQVRHMRDGKQVRTTIGRYPAITLRDARIKASELKAGPAQSNDAGDEPTPVQLLDEWFEKYVMRECRESTQKNYRYTFSSVKNRLPDRPLNQITMDMWLTYFDAISERAPGVTRVVITALKACFNWHIRRGSITPPCMMSLRARDVGAMPKTGSRVLTALEVVKIWRAIEASRAGTANKVIHLLCLVYGCRLSEARNIRRSDLDFDSMVWTVPAEISKTGREIRRPITSIGRQLFDRASMASSDPDYLFPGQNGGVLEIHSCNRLVSRLRSNLGIPHWRIHDARRTLSTRLSELGVSPHVTETMLGHALLGVMAVYNKHDWLEDQRAAYELWWSVLQRELGVGGSPVMAINPRHDV